MTEVTDFKPVTVAHGNRPQRLHPLQAKNSQISPRVTPDQLRDEAAPVLRGHLHRRDLLNHMVGGQHVPTRCIDDHAGPDGLKLTLALVGYIEIFAEQRVSIEWIIVLNPAAD